MKPPTRRERTQQHSIFPETFGPPGLKAGRNDARIEFAVPQPKGGGVAARLSGYESEAERAAAGRELALDDCRPMDRVFSAETRPATTMIVPPDLLAGFAPGRPLHIRS